MDVNDTNAKTNTALVINIFFIRLNKFLRLKRKTGSGFITAKTAFYCGHKGKAAPEKVFLMNCYRHYKKNTS